MATEADDSLTGEGAARGGRTRAEFAVALGAATRAFEAMGAHVRVGPHCENLVRHTPDGFEVQAQGLENLIHELVHALLHGALADDHGFPYGQIPLDMGRAAHREQLFGELACCTLSCRFVLPTQRDAWFAEQLEILPVFYGLELAPATWRGLVSRTVRAHEVQHTQIMRAAAQGLDEALWAGSVSPLLDTSAAAEFAALWATYLASCDAGSLA